MTNKYAKYSKVEEAKENIGRMLGALKTCAKKRTFNTYEKARLAGEKMDLNPYVCPWCDKYHLTSGEGDPLPIHGAILRDFNSCITQLTSHKVETLLRGLVTFHRIENEVANKQRADLYRIMVSIVERIDTLDGSSERKRTLLRKISEAADHS